MAVRLKAEWLAGIAWLFAMTYSAYQTEERILIYQNDAGRQTCIVPKGDRRPGSVECDVELVKIDSAGVEWDLIADLHSRHVMGAFWSRTDDLNERIRGPIFGVCSWAGGQVQWLFRRWNGREFEALTMEQVIADG